ncbi:MAG: pilus assembly protein [Bryobacterales bacterium]|nr:pilus assembly protein [Bryobacterales bacterium]
MKSERGNVILEFALSVGVMAMLFAGTFEFGLTFFRYNTLQTALRNGAQYASMRTYDSDSASPAREFREAVANMVVYGEIRPAANAMPLVVGLDPRMVEVEATLERGVPAFVTVKVKSYVIDAVFAKHTLDGKPSVTFPYLGRFAPPARGKIASAGIRSAGTQSAGSPESGETP